MRHALACLLPTAQQILYCFKSIRAVAVVMRELGQVVVESILEQYLDCLASLFMQHLAALD